MKASKHDVDFRPDRFPQATAQRNIQVEPLLVVTRPVSQEPFLVHEPFGLELRRLLARRIWLDRITQATAVDRRLLPRRAAEQQILVEDPSGNAVEIFQPG